MCNLISRSAEAPEHIGFVGRHITPDANVSIRRAGG
jgi:hypothetical protein